MLGSSSDSSAPSAAPSRPHAKVYRHIAWLDQSLTAALALEVLWILWSYRNEPAAVVAFCVLLLAAKLTAGLTRWVASAVGGKISDHLAHKPLAKAKNMKKFEEQSWQLVVHVLMSIFELHVIEDWTNYLPYAEGGVPSLVRLCYMTQLAIWVYTCYVHRFVERRSSRRKDYYVMYIHHVATIFLVMGSASIGYYRSGLVVLYFHDVSDVVIDVLKMINYMDLSGARFLFASEIAFLSNLGTWVYFRLYRLPTDIIIPSILDTYRFVPPEKIRPDAPYFDRFPWEYPACVSLLVLLVVLHVYWLLILLNIAWKMMRENAHSAGRQGYEGDSGSDERDE